MSYGQKCSRCHGQPASDSDFIFDNRCSECFGSGIRFYLNRGSSKFVDARIQCQLAERYYERRCLLKSKLPKANKILLEVVSQTEAMLEDYERSTTEYFHKLSFQSERFCIGGLEYPTSIGKKWLIGTSILSVSISLEVLYVQILYQAREFIYIDQVRQEMSLLNV